MGYLIVNTKQIIYSKVFISSANLLTPGYIVDIPEYLAVNGYFWNVLFMTGKIANGTTPYTGSSGIHIQASLGIQAQGRFPGTYMSLPTNTFSSATFSATNNTQFVVNDKLQIHNPGTLLSGNNDLVLNIGAILVKQ